MRDPHPVADWGFATSSAEEYRDTAGGSSIETQCPALYTRRVCLAAWRRYSGVASFWLLSQVSRALRASLVPRPRKAGR